MQRRMPLGPAWPHADISRRNNTRNSAQSLRNISQNKNQRAVLYLSYAPGIVSCAKDKPTGEYDVSFTPRKRPVGPALIAQRIATMRATPKSITTTANKPAPRIAIR